MLALLEKKLHAAVSKALGSGTAVKCGPTLGPSPKTEQMVAVAVGEFEALVPSSNADVLAIREKSWITRTYPFEADGAQHNFTLPEDDKGELVEVESPPGHLVSSGDDYFLRDRTLRFYRPPAKQNPAVRATLRDGPARGYREAYPTRIRVHLTAWAKSLEDADTAFTKSLNALLAAFVGIGNIRSSQNNDGVVHRLLKPVAVPGSIERSRQALGKSRFYCVTADIKVFGELQLSVSLGAAKADDRIEQVDFPVENREQRGTYIKNITLKEVFMRRKTGGSEQDKSFNTFRAVKESSTEVESIKTVIETDRLKIFLEKYSDSTERQQAIKKSSKTGDHLKTQPADNWSSFDNWASGGITPLIPRDQIQEELAAIFQGLAEALNRLTNFGEKHILRRNTLYHGHLVYSAAHKEDLLVFHAAEYPIDLETIKAAQAWSIEEGGQYDYAKSSELAEKTGKNYKPFKTGDDINKVRSSVYSITQNKLWILDFRKKMPSQGHAFADLIDTTAGTEAALWLNECYLGDNYTDINYFPKEGVEPFFKCF